MADQPLKDISIIGAGPTGPTGLFGAFGASTHLGEVVTGLRRVEKDGSHHFVLETSEDDYPSRTIIIAAGIGAFEARKLGIEGEDSLEERGLYFKVLDP